jgi:hypothetical protein
MKNKKSSKHYHVEHAAAKVIPMKDTEQTINADEEVTLVRVFYKTGNHRHPVQYWKLVRNKNGNGVN